MTETASRERGVALILVLVLLPLVAILVTQLHFETMIGSRLAQNQLATQQFRSSVNARIRQMRLRLVRDLVKEEEDQEQGQYDHYSDDWGPDSELGGTATFISRGEEGSSDQIGIYTEVLDEQGKFNLNLLLHRDNRRRSRAQKMFVRLLDLFRDDRYKDFEPNDFDLTETEAEEVSAEIIKFLQGEKGNDQIPDAKVPDPGNDMKQGVYTTEDLIFAHRLFLDKRLLETVTDTSSRQKLPSLLDFVTVHGDGRINVNTAPIAVLRALFVEDEGRSEVAEEILRGRGGFLETEEDEDAREERDKTVSEARENNDSDTLDETRSNTVYRSLNELPQQVRRLQDAGFLRRNELELGRDLVVRTDYFTVVVTARRDSFLFQRRVVLRRHNAGCITVESQVRFADVRDLPENQAAEDDTES